MKTLLFPTDFSAGAKYAAEYGYNLAGQIKADIILCNAVIVPAEMAQAGFVAWPADEFELLMDESSAELRLLKSRLEDRDDDAGGFRPEIAIVNRAGTVSDVISDITALQHIDLVVIGPHSNSGLSGFVLGDHARRLIDDATKPILLVPKGASKKAVKKIAFATDFKEPAEDLRYLEELIQLARPLNAGILLTHVYNEKFQSPDFQTWIKQLIAGLTNKTGYPHIFYNLVNNRTPEEGLTWLCERGDIDILAMVHRKHNLLTNLLLGSHTHKMAAQTLVPLLVYPAGLHVN